MSAPTLPQTQILPPADLREMLVGAFTALVESTRSPLPFMVDRQQAAQLCGMSPTTYDKYAKRGLLPGLNATGRIGIEALRLAVRKLDGIDASIPATYDDAEQFEREWDAA